MTGYLVNPPKGLYDYVAAVEAIEDVIPGLDSVKRVWVDGKELPAQPAEEPSK